MAGQEAPLTVHQLGLAEQLFSTVIPDTKVSAVPTPEVIRQFESSLYGNNHLIYFSLPVDTRLRVRAFRIANNPDNQQVGTPQEIDTSNWLAAAGAEKDRLFLLTERYTLFTRFSKFEDGRKLQDLTAEEVDTFCRVEILPLILQDPSASEIYQG